jgi:hypothetical protein
MNSIGTNVPDQEEIINEGILIMSLNSGVKK